MYQVDPIGVVLPRTKDDVRAVLELANRYNVPVLPRGGGTSLIGQTVNHAVVLDFSKYMNQVLEVNREELWCRVQPGVIQDELNAHVRPMGLLFGPDTSTESGDARRDVREQRRLPLDRLREDDRPRPRAPVPPADGSEVTLGT